MIYTIMKCEDGGFIVWTGRDDRDPGMSRIPLFAATEIGIALEYIRTRIEKASRP